MNSSLSHVALLVPGSELRLTVDGQAFSFKQIAGGTR